MAGTGANPEPRSGAESGALALSSATSSGSPSRAATRARSAASRRSCSRRPGRGSKGTARRGHRQRGGRAAGLALADLLDAARAGETLLLISLADGADALVLRVTEAMKTHRSEPLRAQVDRAVTIGYPQYLLWRARLTVRRPRRPDPDRPSAPFAWRNRRLQALDDRRPLRQVRRGPVPAAAGLLPVSRGR